MTYARSMIKLAKCRSVKALASAWALVEPHIEKYTKAQQDNIYQAGLYLETVFKKGVATFEPPKDLERAAVAYQVAYAKRAGS